MNSDTLSFNKQILSFLQSFIDDINKSNSNLDKQSIIKDYYDKNNFLFSLLMDYIFSYKKKYYLTSTNILKREDLCLLSDEIKNYSLFNVLDELNSREITGYNAISTVNGYIHYNSEYKELILKVIDKDIKCRIDAKTINKVIPNLIPTFDVSLGEKFDKNRFNWQEEDWYCSRKLDGIRCIYQNSSEECFSRQGELFWTLDVLKEALSECSTELTNLVLDGELSLITDDGSDDFQGIMKQIRKKNHTIENIRYNVFDVLTQEEFDSKTSNRKFNERYAQLLELKDKLESTGHIKVVLQTKIYSEETFNTLKSKAVENNWEGLMLRKDDFYKGKRSFDLLKYKEFSDAEYIVKSIELGVKPMLIDGTMKDVECVSALHIEHKGYDVKVGSGLIDSQRIEWKEHPENIIGKTIKVKYFEETIDQNGNISLRFPILLMVYENGRFD